MKARKKIDKVDRAYHNGYIAGIKGHSTEICHYFVAKQRGAWLNGWREGREDERTKHHVAELHY